MGSGIKGFKSQKILKTKLKGYTEAESIDPERYVTIQQLTEDRHGLDVISHGVAEIASGLTAAVGSNQRVIIQTAHSSTPGDIVKFTASGIEAPILSTPDANTMILACQLSFDPTGLAFSIVRHVTPKYSLDGSISVSTTPSPTIFILDGSSQQVTEDTTTPANNKALPSKTFIEIDGIELSVKKDSVVPANTVAMPVELTSSAGPLATTITNELSVNDSSANTSLSNIDNKLPSLDANNFIPTSLHGLVDAGNTSSNPLGSGATFTGSWIDCTNFNCIALGVFSDVSSATDGVKYQFSADGVNVHHEHTYTYTGGSYGVGYSVPVEFKYYRAIYINSTVAQASFEIISTLKQSSLFPSSYKLTEPISGQTQSLFTRGVIVGETTAGGGGYVNVKVNPSGALTVDATLSFGTENIGNVKITDGTDTADIIGATSLISQSSPEKGLVAISTIQGIDSLTGTQFRQVRVTPQGGLLIGSTGTVNQATPLIALLMGASDGTNLKSLSVDSSGNLKTAIQGEDRDSGAAGVGTLRTVLATRHEASTTPLALRESDGTNWLSSIALAATQLTSGALSAIKMSASVIMGWDGTTHRELSVDNTGKLSVNASVAQNYINGTLKSNQITVGTSEVRATTDGLAPSSTRQKLMIKPSGSNTGAIFIIASGGSTSTGMEVIGPDRLEFLFDITDYYLISDTPGQKIEIIEVE